MRTVTFGILLWAFGALAVLAWNASAHTSPRIVARVVCAHPAEDTLAHVRLVALTHDADGTYRVRYRCQRSGY